MEHLTVRGVDVPALGLGTWKLRGGDCRRAVETALDLGYRHVDTAQAYGNERAVGEAIAASDVDRDDVFLTTKLGPKSRAADDVRRSTEESLARLRTSYVDLLLIHWPHEGLPWRSVDHGETLEAMNELVEAGRVRHVGVSNFSVDQLHDARERSAAPVLTNQVQFNPYRDQRALLDYCRIHDVLVTAYSPLAHGALVDDERLREVGDRYGKSPAQVAIRWCLDHGAAVVPKASGEAHLAENLAVLDFSLTPAERERLRRPSRLRALAPLVRAQLPV